MNGDYEEADPIIDFEFEFKHPMGEAPKVYVSEIGHMDEPLLEVIPPWPDDGTLRNADGEVVGFIQKFTVSREEMHKIWPELDKS